MQTWVTQAAEQAGPASVIGLMSEPKRAQGGTLARLRRRIVGLLTGMLTDDEEHPDWRLPVLLPAPPSPEPRAAESGFARPYLALVRDPDDDAGFTRPFGTSESPDDGELSFWGPKPPPAASGGGGRRRKRRTDSTFVPASFLPASPEPARPVPASPVAASPVRALSLVPPLGPVNDSPRADLRPGRRPRRRSHASESRRPAPRHAAPSAGFGAIIGRRLASPRLTSRSAAHAGY